MTLFDDLPRGKLKPKRDRSAERRGKSRHSWIKHEYAGKIVRSQAHAYRAAYPDHRILLIDANAGDGEGVEYDKVQRDLFHTETRSRPTPEILTMVAAEIGNADVVLCEKVQKKREALWRLFPQAKIIGDHCRVPQEIRLEDYDFCIWLSDPCGAAGHGPATMRACAARVRTDFVIIFNEQFITQLRGVNEDDPYWRTSRRLYSHYDVMWWKQELRKPWLARTRLFVGSARFHYRFLVLSNYLARATRTSPFDMWIGPNGTVYDDKSKLPK